MARVAASIRFREVAGLTAYARNARTHSEEQVLEIAASMREWGWTMPVLISEGCEGAVDGEIIAGHGRVLAAAAIYSAGETIKMANGADIPPGQVPVVVARGWTEAQRRAYVIADNQIGLNAEWDDAILRMELVDLREFGFNLSKIGFDDAELAGLLDVNLDGDAAAQTLADRFGVPPFSVLNAREGWWQERKAAWLALGIQSELGRGTCAAANPISAISRARATPGGGAMPSANYGKNQARKGETGARQAGKLADGKPS